LTAKQTQYPYQENFLENASSHPAVIPAASNDGSDSVDGRNISPLSSCALSVKSDRSLQSGDLFLNIVQH